MPESREVKENIRQSATAPPKLHICYSFLKYYVFQYIHLIFTDIATYSTAEKYIGLLNKKQVEKWRLPIMIKESKFIHFKKLIHNGKNPHPETS